MARDANKSATAFQELVRVLEEAVRAGCDSVELEWEGRDLAAFQCLGNAAIGTFPFPRALQQVVLDELVQRAGLARKSKGKIPLTLLGENYEVLVLEHDSFGESAFVLKFKKIKKKPAAANDQT